MEPQIPGGYYIKARKIQQSMIARCAPATREVWDWLIKESNHKDAQYAGYSVKRGQCFRTYDDIREGLRWNIGYRVKRYTTSHIKTAMKTLRSNQMITTEKKLTGVLITIVKYDYYQRAKNYEKLKGNPHEATSTRHHNKNKNTDHVSDSTIIKGVDNQENKDRIAEEVAKHSDKMRINPC